MGTYKISLSGRSAIVVLSLVRQDAFEFLNRNNLDIGDYIRDWDNEINIPDYMKPFPPDEWCDGDYGSHAEGILFDEDNDISVEDEDFDTIWQATLNEKDLKNKVGKVFIGSTVSVDDYPRGSLVFVGEVYEGSTYSYEIEMNEKYDPSKLNIEYTSMNGIKIITGISYEGGEIINQESDTTNKGTDLRIEVSKGVESKLPHPFNVSQLTSWFDKNNMPVRNGLYEVKKCDEEVGSILLKWKGKAFFMEEEVHKYDKNWNLKSIKIVDVEVPFRDIVGWRGLRDKIC